MPAGLACHGRHDMARLGRYVTSPVSLAVTALARPRHDLAHRWHATARHGSGIRMITIKTAGQCATADGYPRSHQPGNAVETSARQRAM